MAAERSVPVVAARPGTRLGWVMRTLLLLLWLAARGSTLYFHIGETEKKCFIEEIPDETMVIGAGESGDETGAVVRDGGSWDRAEPAWRCPAGRLAPL